MTTDTDCPTCRMGYGTDSGHADDCVTYLQAKIKEVEINHGRMHMMLMDERGSNRGLACMMCNMRERSACYENTEKLEAEIKSLEAAKEDILAAVKRSDYGYIEGVYLGYDDDGRPPASEAKTDGN